MITVVVRQSGDFRELTATGHASYAPVGQDIVCSAFSMLIYTLVEYVSDYANVYKKIIEPGNVSIGFKVIKQEALIGFNVIIKGLLLLADTYPDNIVIHGNFSENIK